MITKQNTTSDLEILSMIAQNDAAGWKNLYDKYALTMFVAILWIVDDGVYAENLLAQLFAQLKTNKAVLSTKRTLCASLLYFTYITTYKILRANRAIGRKERNQNEVFSKLNELVYRPYSAMNVAKIQEMKERTGVARLYSDLNKIGIRNLQKNKPQKEMKLHVAFMPVV